MVPFSCFLVILIFSYSFQSSFIFSLFSFTSSCPILSSSFLFAFTPLLSSLNFFPICQFNSTLLFLFYTCYSYSNSLGIFYITFWQCPVKLGQPFKPWGWEGRGLGGEKMGKEADLNTLLSYRLKKKKKKCYLCKVRKHSLTDSPYAILSSNLFSYDNESLRGMVVPWRMKTWKRTSPKPLGGAQRMWKDWRAGE